MIPASPLSRLGARLVEAVVFFAIATLTFGACAVASDGARSEQEAWMPFLLSITVVPAVVSLVHLVLTASAGGTLGKRVFGLRVCTLDGEPASLWRLLVRELLFFFGLSVTVIPVIDLVLAFVRPDARGLSDLLLGTQIMKVSAVQSAP
ncbi:MAG: hypothetical protein RIT28_2989 [Pseudomonadota bacterium]|jgi:uncharacterized RDD family membrane protein YckC